MEWKITIIISRIKLQQPQVTITDTLLQTLLYFGKNGS